MEEEEEEEKKQQLVSSNIPGDAAQVLCSMVEGLKATRGSSCALDVKTLSNSPEEHKTWEQVEYSILVFVLNKNGKALMPCTAGKARRLLKSGKAKVIKRTPFTIQLIYGY